MNRRALLIFFRSVRRRSGGCSAVLIGFQNTTPQLRLLGFTNSSSGAGKVATLQFYNSAGHTVYLLGLTENDSPFFQPGDEIYTWGLANGRQTLPAIGDDYTVGV